MTRSIGFAWRGSLGGRFLVYEPWQAAGIQHGFGGINGFWDPVAGAVDRRAFCGQTGVTALRLLKQVHGTALLRAEPLVAAEQSPPPDLAPAADGWLLDFSQSQGTPLAWGMLSADCVPLMLRCGLKFALVHAGWRGLAGGILEKALEHLSPAAAGDLEVLIGPCAGAANYEVGQDVLTAFHGAAIHTPTLKDRFRLDLPATAEFLLKRSAGPKIKVAAAGICTIASPHFFSFRRQGAAAGRNLSFLSCLGS